MQSGPELGGLSGSEVKLSRQHADDDIRSAIESDYAAQHVAFSTVPVLPGRITQQSSARRGR